MSGPTRGDRAVHPSWRLLHDAGAAPALTLEALGRMPAAWPAMNAEPSSVMPGMPAMTIAARAVEALVASPSLWDLVGAAAARAGATATAASTAASPADSPAGAFDGAPVEESAEGTGASGDRSPARARAMIAALRKSRGAAGATASERAPHLRSIPGPGPDAGEARRAGQVAASSRAPSASRSAATVASAEGPGTEAGRAGVAGRLSGDAASSSDDRGSGKAWLLRRAGGAGVAVNGLTREAATAELVRRAVEAGAGAALDTPLGMAGGDASGAAAAALSGAAEGGPAGGAGAGGASPSVDVARPRRGALQVSDAAPPDGVAGAKRAASAGEIAGGGSEQTRTPAASVTGAAAPRITRHGSSSPTQRLEDALARLPARRPDAAATPDPVERAARPAASAPDLAASLPAFDDGGGGRIGGLRGLAARASAAAPRRHVDAPGPRDVALSSPALAGPALPRAVGERAGEAELASRIARILRTAARADGIDLEGVE